MNDTWLNRLTVEGLPQRVLQFRIDNLPPHLNAEQRVAGGLGLSFEAALPTPGELPAAVSRREALAWEILFGDLGAARLEPELRGRQATDRESALRVFGREAEELRRTAHYLRGLMTRLGAPHAQAWRRDHWGTPADVLTGVSVGIVEGGLSYLFRTEENCPNLWALAIASRYPDLRLTLEFEAPAARFAGRHRYVRGEPLDMIEAVPWEARPQELQRLVA